MNVYTCTCKLHSRTDAFNIKTGLAVVLFYCCVYTLLAFFYFCHILMVLIVQYNGLCPCSWTV